METLTFTQEEKQDGQMESSKLARAVRALDTDGLVVLEGIVDTSHLDLLHEQMREDLAAILARPDVPFNFNTGNVQQDPPPFHPFLFRDILLNDLVIQVTSAVLGPNPHNGYYSGNTALPGGGRQPVHPDVAQLWPNLAHPTPAFGLVVNIPVVDMGPENGATELWPGTHHDTTYSIHQGSARISEDDLNRWRKDGVPLQPTVARGSVLIRDIRLWHAGMPNHTDVPRPMIAMIHWCGWWPGETATFARGTESFFEHPILKTKARFEDKVNHVLHNAAYDLDK